MSEMMSRFELYTPVVAGQHAFARARFDDMSADSAGAVQHSPDTRIVQRPIEGWAQTVTASGVTATFDQFLALAQAFAEEWRLDDIAKEAAEAKRAAGVEEQAAPAVAAPA